jgi:hypothetical protein
MSAIKKIFVSLGAMCGLYASVELMRVIKYYIDHVSFLYLFGFEYAILIIAIAWIIVSAVDDLFMKSDYLGGD